MGLGTHTERELGEIIWVKDPSVMFIAETWADEARLDRTLSTIKSLNNIDSLFFKVFKASFFPHCSILEAKDSVSGLYAWKSILRRRDVNFDGACW